MLQGTRKRWRPNGGKYWDGFTCSARGGSAYYLQKHIFDIKRQNQVEFFGISYHETSGELPKPPSDNSPISPCFGNPSQDQSDPSRFRPWIGS